MRLSVQSAVLTLTMAAGLAAMAMGNEVLLEDVEVTEGVHWIYLPAGLRMGFVLVCPLEGALAIFLASLVMASRDPSLTPALVVASALVTAAGPALARVVAISRMGLSADLGNLSWRLLLGLSIVFAVCSTTLHQAFYSALGREPAFLPMLIGDTLGCLICLYGIKASLMLWRRLKA